MENTLDLRQLSSTCRYLNDISMTLYFKGHYGIISRQVHYISGQDSVKMTGFLIIHEMLLELRANCNLFEPFFQDKTSHNRI